MKKRNNLVNRTKFLAITLLIILFVLLIFFLPRLVKINKISCRNQYGHCNGYLNEKLDKVRGVSLPETKKRVGELLKAETSVGDFFLQYKLPDILVVDIIERKPSYSLFVTPENIYASVDSEGFIMRLEATTNLPYVKVNENAGNPGEQVSERNLFALKVMEKVFSSYLVKEGEIKDDSLVVILPPSLKVIFPLAGDADLLTASLDLVIRRLKADAEVSRMNNNLRTEIYTIDMRFRNPVLR